MVLVLCSSFALYRALRISLVHIASQIGEKIAAMPAADQISKAVQFMLVSLLVAFDIVTHCGKTWTFRAIGSGVAVVLHFEQLTQLL